ncbi:peptidylprolyl isomerase [Priestia taiwanensis]|uniref:Foldase protein PrsA n=1 Tax=Priestia taiwanensis TaxID=1347902 RepID=A0A917ES66_9BACI|nr:peptidylprolyl isomerase [Priestia taiwanensis]MBM7364247.1 foldase protein PrsA [Priestia taiwanensis]GGE72868.1 foldase protein PrsA [Priestia taiwanensis]
MKKAFVAIAVSTSLFVLSACGNNSDTVVESSAGNVTKEELYTAMKTSKVGGSDTLKLLVTEKVLDKKYDVTDAEIDEEIKKVKEQTGEKFDMALKQAGLKDEAALKKFLNGQLLIQKAIEESLTEEELNTPKVKVSHILIQTEGKDAAAAEAKAKEIKAKVDAGEDFATLAKEHSEDDGTKEKGGDVGTIVPGQMVPEFEAAALKLKTGEVSDLVKSKFGYHIIKATERTEYSELSEAEQKAAKEQAMQVKYSNGAAEKIIQKELDDAKVEVKDDDFKDLFKAPEEAEKK